MFYLTTHTATPELPEIRNAYHSVLVSLLLSVDVDFSLCVFYMMCSLLTICGIQNFTVIVLKVFKSFVILVLYSFGYLLHLN